MTRTFREAALSFLEAKTADAKISDAKRKQNLSQLKAYVFPALGKLQVQSIDADTIAACLRPIWTARKGLGSGLIYSQKATAVASATAERKLAASLS